MFNEKTEERMFRKEGMKKVQVWELAKYLESKEKGMEIIIGEK